MTATALHADVQRSRFVHHAFAAIAGMFPALVPWPRDHAHSEPPLGAVESAAREAAQVRELAYAYSKTDPGFAADLYAAAARHEALHAR